MTDRKVALKSFLWLFIGIWIAVTLARFVRGLGATTNLSDSSPWGLWIAFDVMSGVALAAGGFVIAAVVYIFHLYKYKSFARPAILTAFLGYIAVAVGLLYDLGIPLNIWHAPIYPQPHSVLFEVAMCVMLYLTVLFLEFCPVILEHSWFNRSFFKRIHAILKKIAIPLVITGIVLSTLHQSSLGSLFLIVPDRVHPLWYSPILWVLFFVSAIGLGLMMVAAETLFSSWYFGHKLRIDLLSNLGRAASFVLFGYAALRLGDLALRERLGYIFDGTWQANIFLLEIGLAAILPATLLAFRKIRSSPVGIGIASGLTLLGMVGYRFNLCIVAFARPEGVSYFPTWMEISVTLGIVAAAMLVFIFFVEHLNVCDAGHPDAGHEHDGAVEENIARRPRFDPLSLRILTPESLAAARRYSLALVVGVALAAAALPRDVWRNSLLLCTPVHTPMIFSGTLTPGAQASRLSSYQINLQPPGQTGVGDNTTQLLVIDGNRNGRLVAFPHQFHRENLGDDESCVLCHHQALPFDQNTSCHKCHRDMFATTDIFDHSVHIAQLDGNAGCSNCHADETKAKLRETTTPCGECHENMALTGSFLAPKEEAGGYAAGYMDAMHGLCIDCHQQKLEEAPQDYRQGFADCGSCHRDIDGTQFRRMSPYVANRNSFVSTPGQTEVNNGTLDYEN